jgi:hypothetical protein
MEFLKPVMPEKKPWLDDCQATATGKGLRPSLPPDTPGADRPCSTSVRP